MENRQQSEITHNTASWKRYLPIFVAIFGGASFSLVAFLAVRSWETLDIETAFRLAAEDRSYAVKGTFETELGMLELARSAISSVGQINREEFKELVNPFISYSHSIFAVEWVPRVPENRRLDFEEAAKGNGFEDFQITEMDGSGQMVRASRRGEYFPIYLIGPQTDNKTVFGFDIASEPTRLEALFQARDSGKTVASGRITFVQEGNKAPLSGFLIYLPVYEKGESVESIENRRENFKGVVLGVFKPHDMIESAIARLQPEGIDISLYDPSVSVKGAPFHFHSSRTRTRQLNPADQARLLDPRGMRYVASLDMAGHGWSIMCFPTPEFIAARRTWWPWNVMAAGLGFTAMLAAYLLLSIDHKTHIEDLLIEKRRYSQMLESKVRAQTLHIRRAQEEVIHRLVSASQCRDEETGMHIRRTGLLSELLARLAGWSDTEAEVIRQAAPMHDIGKIGIPDAILRKPGKLTPEEYVVMKTHATIGADMLTGSTVPMLQMAREIALNHHEKWDGSGYPVGRTRYDIPESARILAIVDVFDALSHDRVYRPAMTEEQVLAIMEQGVGTHFDPLLMTYFFANYAEFRRIALENPDETLKDEPVGVSHAPMPPVASHLEPSVSSMPTS